MEVSFGPFHDERIVSSSCQTPCTRSGAKENQLMKHSMREAPGIISHTARFVNIISFSSPPFPPLLFPSPKSRPRRRKGASGQNYRIRFSGFFNLPPPRRKGGRQTGERERQSLSEWLWQQLARRQINRDEDGWMWPSINPEVAKSWPPPRPLPTF